MTTEDTLSVTCQRCELMEQTYGVDKRTHDLQTEDEVSLFSPHFTMTNFKTWLSLLCVAPLIFLLWHHQPGPCQKTLSYRVGRFDHRFGLRQAEFLSLIEQAASIWEASVGKDLFAYDPAADFTVNLVFDGRQRTTVARQELVHKLQRIESSHTHLATSFEQLQALYKEKNAAYQLTLADYQTRLDTYNDNVRLWNNNRGMMEEFHKLIRVRQQLLVDKAELDKERLYLIDLLETLQSMQEQGETMASTYHNQRQTYQARFARPSRFNQGEYDGRGINIYQFNDPTDLMILLIHELGHALGLGHVDHPQAMMYYLKGQQDSAQPVLTRHDIGALKAACHLD